MKGLPDWMESEERNITVEQWARAVAVQALLTHRTISESFSEFAQDVQDVATLIVTGENPGKGSQL